MKILVLSVLFLLPASAIAGDHDSNERRTRPEAESAMDCGGRAGNLSVRHAGKGLFAASTYELEADFGENDELRIQTNLGWNLDLHLRLHPLSIHWFGKDIDCTSSRHAAKCASLVKRVQSKVQAAWDRKKSLSVSEQEAFQCLDEKLKKYASTIDRYVPVYEPSPSTYDPGPRNDTGGIGFTFDGKAGIKIAPNVVMPFDGSGIGLGF